MTLPYGLYAHITTATTTNLTSSTPSILYSLTNNVALTGTITIKDGTNNVAVLTNPGVGQYLYNIGINGSLSIVTSATCDVTVSYQLL
jgi:hypothetical protein